MIVEKDIELLQQIFGDGTEIKVKGKVITPMNGSSRATCLPLEGDVRRGGRGRNSSEAENNTPRRYRGTPLKRGLPSPNPLSRGDDEMTKESNQGCVHATTQTYLYIHNPDKTMRWIVPANQRQPYFLNLYNGSGWRGFLINNYYKIGFQLGLKKWICNGSFEVKGGTEMPKENYAIFTGTKGENRKVIITSGAPNRPSGYWKLPLTAKAKRLTETEGNVLNELNNCNFKTLEIPKTKFEKGGVWVSNVQPKKYKNETAIGSSHVNALRELFDKTEQVQKLSNLPAWNDIQNDLNGLSTSNIKNDLSPSKVQKLTSLLMQLRNQFSDSDLLPTYQAHGDFTPWNMFTSEENTKLHLFDWELSERLSAFYDLFHFIFQTGILVEKKGYVEIKTMINSILKQSDFQRFIKDSDIDIEQVYQFYLLKNCSYYLKRYLNQKDLHAQVYWLIDVWLEALTQVCSNTIKEQI